MARKSSLTELQKIEIAEWVQINSTQHGRGAVKRAADHFGLTPAIIKSALPKVEKPEGEMPKAEKPAKVKKPRKAKPEKSTDSMELFKQLRQAENEVSRIKAALLKILG